MAFGYITSVVVVMVVATVQSYSPETWMTDLHPLISNLTLLDITLPGTHDSMTWDLSTTVSDNANDLPPWLSYLLHDLGNVADAGEFIHQQAKSQNLNMTEQLNAGIRFIDFRVTDTASSKNSSAAPYQWYCLHLVETKHEAITYLESAKVWLDSHPMEVLTMWISHHGSPCSNHYHSDPATQQAFFQQVTALFSDLVFNTSEGGVNETTIGTLIAKNQRLVLYVSSYYNMTQGSPLATDACLIDNQLGDSSSDESHSRPFLLSTFADAHRRRAQDKANNRLFLLSMSGGAPKEQMVSQFWLTYLPHIAHNKTLEQCAHAYRIPGMDNWCPATLRASVQLANYYNQYPLEQTILNASMELPGAIYINAVGDKGTIRTGLEITGTTRAYAYVDTVVLFNALKPGGCAASNSTVCQSLIPLIERRRAMNPLTLWEDVDHGRHVHWPPN